MYFIDLIYLYMVANSLLTGCSQLNHSLVHRLSDVSCAHPDVSCAGPMAGERNTMSGVQCTMAAVRVPILSERLPMGRVRSHSWGLWATGLAAIYPLH